MNISSLKNLFKECNQKYFNNEIKPVTIKISNSRSGGYVEARRVNGKYQVENLSISKAYKYTSEQLEKVMVHEMIHVLLFQRNLKHGHCYLFNSEVNRIKEEYDFIVPIKLFKNLEVTKKISRYYFQINKDGKDLVLFTTIQKSHIFQERLLMRDYKIEKQGQVTSPDLMKFSACQKRVAFYPLETVQKYNIL